MALSGTYALLKECKGRRRAGPPLRVQSLATAPSTGGAPHSNSCVILRSLSISSWRCLLRARQVGRLTVIQSQRVER